MAESTPWLSESGLPLLSDNGLPLICNSCPCQCKDALICGSACYHPASRARVQWSGYTPAAGASPPQTNIPTDGDHTSIDNLASGGTANVSATGLFNEITWGSHATTPDLRTTPLGVFATFLSDTWQLHLEVRRACGSAIWTTAMVWYSTTRNARASGDGVTNAAPGNAAGFTHSGGGFEGGSFASLTLTLLDNPCVFDPATGKCKAAT